MAEVVACKICGKTFSYKKVVKEHEKLILSNIPCNLLNKNILCFRILIQLKVHAETVHEKSTEYSCPFCGQILSSETKIKRHTQRQHGGAELLKCYCNIVFKILFL